MSDYVEFEDYSMEVKKALKDKSIQFLHEAGAMIKSQTIRNSRRKTGQTAGSYQHKVDESGLSVHIGSDFQNAIWEEFGTGEFSTKGSGRKGWWIFVDNGSGARGSGGKNYSSKEEAKRAVAILRSKGLNAYYTKGKKAHRPLFNAFTTMKPKIINLAEEIFGGLN